MRDERQAAIYLQKFTAEFGSKPSARNEQWVRDGGSHAPEPIA